MSAAAEDLIEQFREAIETQLGAQYYFDEAPDTATYPYRVGSLSGSFSDEVALVYSYDLDYWDKGKTTRRIRQMIRQDAALHRLRLSLPGGVVALYMDGETYIPDTNKSLRRIRVNYTARFYPIGG